MKKSLLIFLFLQIQNLYGQQDSTDAKKNQNSLIIFSGANLIGINSSTFTASPNIRKFIKNNQYNFDRHDYYIPLGIAYRHKKIKISLEGELPVFTFSNPNKKTAVFTSSSYGLRLGYDVVNSRNKRVFLSFGVGAYQNIIQLYNPIKQNVNMQDLLTTNFSVNQLKNEGLFWNFDIESYNKEKRKKDISEGYRIGIRFNPKSVAWKANGFMINDPIKDDFLQFYFNFIILGSKNFTPKSQDRL